MDNELKRIKEKAERLKPGSWAWTKLLIRLAVKMVEDSRRMLEAKIEQTKREIKEQIETSINKAFAALVALTFFFIAFLFILIAASLGIGALIGHPAWGFLIVAVLLAVVGVIVLKTKPDIAGRAEKKMEEGNDK